MSEEELKIIQYIQYALDNVGSIDFGDFSFDDIQGLLDLYNKEKEKREIAEENHKVLSLDLGKALKELGLYEDTIIADELALEINKRYVSKDKIREKIKSLNKEYEEEYKDGQEWEIQDDIQAQISVLEELLEEE